jgi:trehalose 2-sulfotransferase
MRRFIPDYPEEFSSQIAIAVRVGTTANRCFSIKLHTWHFDRLSNNPEILNAFPAPRFVRLTRRDLLGQAVSLVRARQTGRYHASTDEGRTPNFDGATIYNAIKEIAINRARWDTFFARNDLKPLRVEYEDLEQNPKKILLNIGALVNERLKLWNYWTNWTSASLIPQRDKLSREWKARFRLEYHNLGYLDLFNDCTNATIT